MISPIIAIHFPHPTDNISGAFAIFIIPITPMAMIPNPRAIISSIHRPIRSIPKSAMSMMAVGLHILANANIPHEIKIYFREFLLNSAPCS